MGRSVSEIDLVLRSRRVVTPDGVRPATVAVAEGRIAAVGEWDAAPAGAPCEELGELALLPGAVDSHVHVNEPGRSAWEGFETATRAAAAGGVTTIVDMPLNSIPATTNAAALAAKRRAATGRCHVDVGFWGGVVPGNRRALAALDAAGALGFKAFLAPSGVEEFPAISLDELAASALEIRRLGSLLLVHAEAPERLASAPSGDPRRHATWLAARPVEAEDEAIAALVEIARATTAPIHVVHVSSAAGVARIAAARRAGLPVSGEACPHYLTFCAEEIPDGATELKCAPPIRGRAEREALWQALGAGSLALVASDHSPCPPELKRRESGDFFAAWGGIASLQLSLSALWSEARERGLGLEVLARWLAAGPAALAGLAARKGAIAPGRDADLVVFDPETSYTVEPLSLYHRHPMTPYSGRRLTGRVLRTYLRGAAVFDREPVGAPRGRLLSR